MTSFEVKNVLKCKKRNLITTVYYLLVSVLLFVSKGSWVKKERANGKVSTMEKGVYGIVTVGEIEWSSGRR